MIARTDAVRKYQREYHRKWRKGNHKWIKYSKDYQKTWRAENKEYFITYRNARRKIISERNAIYFRRYTESLSNCYIRSVLANGTFLSAKDFPPEIVEIKRKHITALRLIRKKQTKCT